MKVKLAGIVWCSCWMLACTGEAVLVPGLDSGAGASASGGGGTISSGGAGGVIASGGSGGQVCQAPTSPSSNCNTCLASNCLNQQSACVNANNACGCGASGTFTGQASCMFDCLKNEEASPTNRDACAVNCGSTSDYHGLVVQTVNLFDCLAPMGNPPICPCFTPPGPPPN